jgi:sporulation protein YlmC with PRC-barrel domain
MRTKYIIAALLATSMLSVSATAQSQSEKPSSPPAAQQTTPPPATTQTDQAPKASATRVETTTAIQTSGQWRASKLVGVDVYNPQNEKIGDISEVLIDQSGKVTGVVIGVGGFLGMGQHDVLVKLEDLKFVNEPVRTSSTTPSTTGTNAPASTTGTRPVRAATEKWYPDHAVMNTTKDQLKAMAAFKYQ